MMALFLLQFLIAYVASERSFVIDYDNNQFLKDGKPFQYVSGGIHYFRVPKSMWEDRLQKMRKAGLNTIQTYIAWNIHEPYPGDYNFQNQADIEEFIILAQQHNLLVILRPGPYICAEWEYGGLPYWIMKSCQETIRTSDPVYLQLVDKWFFVLLTKLRSYLYENGGPVIAVQVENEYGSFGCDHEYMMQMEQMYRKYLGDNVVLFTTDGDGDGYLKCGALPSLYTTVDFGPGGDVENAFAVQRKYQQQGPLVNSEYYTGWLDHWGEKHHTTSATLVASYLDKMLALNASVNMYMFEGGTNFGFMNGANNGGKYAAQPTSYDYDAPLSEAGDPTEKYFAIQKVISKYFDIPSGPQPTPSDKAAYGKFYANQVISVYHLLEHITPVTHTTPLSFEEIDLAYNHLMYRTHLPRTVHDNTLKLHKFHDRAIILVDQAMQGILDQNYNSSLTINHGDTLDIIIENQGRVNYGPYLRDTAKGILSNVTLGNISLKNWQMYPFGKMWNTSMKACSVVTNDKSILAPVVATFTFDVFQLKDTFLKLDKWTKGYAELNQFNAGRYWTPLGPQKTLYIPKSFLLTGTNTLIIYEFDSAPKDPDDMFVEFVDEPILA